ncbi:alpha/beta hydrolase [Caulobacter sp. 17J80-11]|uniref:alpha/beta hydrolase n=1 Tax=Caulobacter sp. 17J80-11 TaxID=2763502 RepID=UPI0016538A38|nr:alpha/beta hydrolase-fold protein [Caulobacter sp. 17J80-11]MBC6981991.1 alpha/beta hydrolase [Caulobacter sp. 17J80-11]
MFRRTSSPAVVLCAVLLLGGPAIAGPAAKADEGRPIVIGRSFELPSKVLGEVRRINVYVPPSYAKGDARYPVLYVIDGGEDQDFHHISGLAQLGTISGTTQDLIVVGIETVDRRHELTTRSADPAYVKRWPTHGASADFRRYVADEVIPFVEARWRADGERAVMGESLAGLFVLETFLREPGMFDRYVAISPSLWWDGGALAAEAPALLAKHDGAERTLWMTVADEGDEMQARIDDVVAALKAKPPSGLKWSYAPRPNETHATIYHAAALDALRALYGPKPETSAAR